jgi:hypothetical protein
MVDQGITNPHEGISVDNEDTGVDIEPPPPLYSADDPHDEMIGFTGTNPFQWMVERGIRNPYEGIGVGNQDLAHTSDYSLYDEAAPLDDNISAGNTSYDLDSESASIDQSAAQSVVDAASATSNEGLTRDPLDDNISATQTPSDASSIDERYSLRRVHVAEQVAEGVADQAARVAAWEAELQRQQADEHSREGRDGDGLGRD